jgi:hypothetical protein
VVDAFAVTAALVDRAKSVLLATVPSPRGVPGPPLAEALLGFEEALREAAATMAEWRRSPTIELWTVCRDALGRSLAAADRLRQDAPALDYEGLVTVLGDLMDPLEAFDEAARLLRGR